MSKDSLNVTSLPVSAAGHLRSNSPAGQMIDLSGPVVVPVSRSQSLDSAGDSTTKGTCGQHGSASYASASLQSFLESRLQARPFGSTWCCLTWSKRITPAGRQICRLRVSALDTLAKGSGLLPTPTRRDGRTLRGSQPPKRSPTSGLPLAWFIATRLGIFEGRLNPIKIGLLMGYPESAIRLAPSAMPSFHRSQQSLFVR